MFVVETVRFPSATEGATSSTVRLMSPFCIPPSSASGSCMGSVLTSGGTSVYTVHVMRFPYMDVLLSFGKAMRGACVLTSLIHDVYIRGI